MLVLTRRNKESVVVEGSDGLGSRLKITVLHVRGGEVRLGFDGPARIAVHRLEVWERIRSLRGEEEGRGAKDRRGGLSRPRIPA
jgi:carbon storage regulator